MYDNIKEAAKWISTKIDGSTPDLAIILGTGLGPLADEIKDAVTIPYSDIPHFPISTVEGHAGVLILGTLNGKRVLAMKGRFHYYEGYTMQEVTFPVRVMYELGVRTLIVSNAAGGANKTFSVGDIMLIIDHINAFPDNPLRGKNLPTGPRFPDMHEAYDKGLVSLADKVAERLNIPLRHGVYYGTMGPSFETPAEYRAFARLGADAVGMSTVPEVIVARHCGIKVLGLSIITNIGVSDVPTVASHEEVLEAGRKATTKVTRLVSEIMKEL